MRVFKTKAFVRFARRERIDDSKLCEAVSKASKGLIDANLGGGLIKQRVSRPGEGRSGGYRTLMAFRSYTRTVFVYGFAKNERDNINDVELDFWRRVAGSFLNIQDSQLDELLKNHELIEMLCP